MKTRFAICFFAMSMALLPWRASADDFTPEERQSINAPTAGLFSKSKSFSIDFTAIKDGEYSFPLPVGKAEPSARGLEITTTKGDIVLAMFGGVVRLARTTPSHGNVVVLRHANGLETVYAGNYRNLVKAGQHVKAGQRIAIAGGSGETAKTNFEIMVNGCNINPLTLLSAKTHKLYKHVYTFTDRGRSVAVEVSDDAEKYEEDDAAAVDLDREITERERADVAVSTPGLFANSNTITINFAEMSEGQWCYPLEDSKVISPYGGKRRHSGVDIKKGSHDEIHAAFAGKVRFAKRYSGYGNVIVVRHASGLETLYSHNSQNLVKVGDWVKAGQVIAISGRTGRATTEHCHFEIRINGRSYNPALIYDHANHQLKHVKLVVSKSGKISITPVK